MPRRGVQHGAESTGSGTFCHQQALVRAVWEALGLSWRAAVGPGGARTVAAVLLAPEWKGLH